MSKRLSCPWVLFGEKLWWSNYEVSSPELLGAKFWRGSWGALRLRLAGKWTLVVPINSWLSPMHCSPCVWEHCRERKCECLRIVVIRSPLPTPIQLSTSCCVFRRLSHVFQPFFGRLCVDTVSFSFSKTSCDTWIFLYLLFDSISTHLDLHFVPLVLSFAPMNAGC